MSTLIGFGGVATSGKDECANRLRDVHGWFKTYMSSALERALLILNPNIPIEGDCRADESVWERYSPAVTWLSYKQLHALVGYDLSKTNYEVRRLLQVLGTEVGRNMFGDDCWLNLVFKDIDTAMEVGRNATVTGIRYRNELEWLRERGGIAVWVDRGLAPVNDHSSDNALKEDDFDWVILNHGSLEDLYREVDGLARYEVDALREKIILRATELDSLELLPACWKLEAA